MFAHAVSAIIITLHIDACRFATLWTDQHHIRDVHFSLELDATWIDLPTGLSLNLTLVFGADVDTLYHYATLIRQDVDHFAAFAFVFKAPTDYFYSVAFANFDSHTSTLQASL
jgi:hypothetical protein